MILKGDCVAEKNRERVLVCSDETSHDSIKWVSVLTHMRILTIGSQDNFSQQITRQQAVRIWVYRMCVFSVPCVFLFCCSFVRIFSCVCVSVGIHNLGLHQTFIKDGS